MYPGEMGDMKSLVDKLVSTSWMYTPANEILNAIDSKKAANTLFTGTTVPAYDKLRTEYDTALKKLVARDQFWYYTIAPATRPTSDYIAIPPMPTRPLPPTKYDWLHYSATD